jgi:putative FmdB family regulatory protein
MPIYEYKCENGHVFDIMQRMSEDPLTKCVECGAPVRKVLHPVGISFKGSGFYSTDYSNKSSKTDPKETTKTDSSSSSNGNGSEKKTEKASSTESAAKKAD